jgi:dual specificity protein kinase YAK1
MSSTARPVLNPQEPDPRIPAEWWSGRATVRRGDLFEDPDGDAYVALEFLGRGTFSDVVKCRVRGCAPALAALKLFRSGPAFRAAGERECAAHRALAAQPERPGRAFVARPLAAFEAGAHLCLALPLLSPFAFPALLPDPAWRARRIRPLVAGLCEALAFVHAAGVAHLDVKPENLLFDPDDPDHALLADFGSARRADVAGAAVQTTQYRSPEAILGLPVGRPADVWSAGCVAAELFLGAPLFGFAAEADVVLAAAAVVGPPPAALLARAPRAREFFDGADPREDPALVVRTRHEVKGLFARGVTLDEILAGDGAAQLRDLVHGLLEWDPARRMSAEEASAHEYCRCAWEL